MPKNKHYRFRVDLRDTDANYFSQLADRLGITTTAILKMVLADAARRGVDLGPLGVWPSTAPKHRFSAVLPENGPKMV